MAGQLSREPGRKARRWVRVGQVCGPEVRSWASKILACLLRWLSPLLTAGGVAIESTIGHAISNMLFGSSSSYTFVPVEQAAPVQQQACQRGSSCEVQAKDFTQCLEKADLWQSCSWHLEQLKAVSQIRQVFLFILLIQTI